MLTLIIILSLVNATLIISLTKWGWFDWYEARKPKWLKWCKPCRFCFGFRLSAVECAIFAFFIPTWTLLVIPFCCAALIYFILK